MHKVDDSNYIYKVIRRDGVLAYSLRIPCKDTGNIVYIKGSNDINFLRKIRNEILKKPRTEKQLLQFKKKYKHKSVNPTVSKYIIKSYSKKGEPKYRIQYNTKSFGTYSTLQEAEDIRNKLIENNWDETKVSGIQVKRRNRNPLTRYIYKQKNEYCIKRLTSDSEGNLSRITYDSGIPTLEEAMQLRDWWVSVGWDWDRIDEI